MSHYPHAPSCPAIQLDDLFRGPCDCEADDLCDDDECEDCAPHWGGPFSDRDIVDADRDAAESLFR